MTTRIKDFLVKFTPIRYYVKGKNFFNDSYYIKAREKEQVEKNKKPSRTTIINFLLSQFDSETTYLEIGVRNPNDNFNHINANVKYSVDPGVEFKENPVDFQLTSDNFFRKLSKGEILSSAIKFDVIFIDGLHLAEQVDRDIINSINFIKDDGFIVLHDCNPPTEWHTRTEYYYLNTPAQSNWNGTTWKAFVKWRSDSSVQSCCVNSDWGIGVLTKKWKIGDALKKSNQFYEFKEFDDNRKAFLNLIDFDDFKKLVTRLR